MDEKTEQESWTHRIRITQKKGVTNIYLDELELKGVTAYQLNAPGTDKPTTLTVTLAVAQEDMAVELD